jgi:hypothetical protein
MPTCPIPNPLSPKCNDGSPPKNLLESVRKLNFPDKTILGEILSTAQHWCANLDHCSTTRK